MGQHVVVNQKLHARHVHLKIPRDDFTAIVNRDPRVAITLSQRLGHRIKELRV